ncbi:MAG TPA: DUF2474 family protein [Sphingobium sp.]|nr:DUF2474 family protein [Sphingobium sp.]
MSPRAGPLRRFGWFTLIYAGGVLALGGVSLLLRWWIG